MKKRLYIFLAALLLLAAHTACAEKEITAVAQLNAPDVVVGTSQGSAAELTVRAELPEAQIVYFPDNNTAYLAVAQGKIAAYAYDYRQMRLALEQGVPGVHLLEETLGEPVRIAVGISPVSKIPDLEKKLNQFIRKTKTDGTLDDMYCRWVMEGSAAMPDIALPKNPSLHLAVGTVGTVPPYSYYAGTELTGFDIELAYRFAAWLGADVRFSVYDFGAIVPAALSGNVDCIMSNLNVTPERQEALPFSEVLYEEKIGVMVRGEPAGRNGAQSGGYTALDQLAHARIGIQTGTTFDGIVLETFPEAQISYFNSYADMAAAVEAHKIDAFPGDEPVMRLMAAEDDKLAIIDGYLDSFELGMIFPKTEAGEKLRDEVNAYLAAIRESGELERLIVKWTDGPEEEKTLPDYAAFPAPKGILTMANEAAYPPMSYYRNDEVTGLEIDLAARFCEANGYGLKVEVMNFDGILPAVQAGKTDFSASGLSITEERKESVYFSDPYYIGGTVLAVLKTEPSASAGAAETQRGPSFLEGIRASFEKTFLRENRWELFDQGVGTTLLITVLSILCGTALGFGVFMLCRNGNALANGAARFSMGLVQGTPMVVLLMILYYIIFGSVAVSGIFVAVIGFTLTFGSSVFGLLKMGVGAVDHGQYEAAYALGYSSRRTFFRIILPQALPHVVSAYKGEIVSLIKATAIVGYIAVQDLTKMGDIVRSRTYEAFFPLIAITVIYFALEGLLGFLVSRISVSFDPKRRKPADILKGVKTDD